MRDVGIRIRVQRDLRERFQLVRPALNKPAAHLLREFMWSHVDEHEELLADVSEASSASTAKGW